MLIAIGSNGEDFGAESGEFNGGKTLLITDPNSGISIQIYLNNEAAKTLGEALANTEIVIPQGHDVMKLVKLPKGH